MEKQTQNKPMPTRLAPRAPIREDKPARPPKRINNIPAIPKNGIKSSFTLVNHISHPNASGSKPHAIGKEGDSRP